MTWTMKARFCFAGAILAGDIVATTSQTDTQSGRVLVGDARAVVLVPGFEITEEASRLDHPTQIAFGPDGRLYVATRPGVILAFDYGDQGILGAPTSVASGIGVTLLGIGFDSTGNLYVSSNDGVQDSGFLARLIDVDQDGFYEQQERFVTRLPNAEHHNDQIAIVGTSLYVGMGSRTDDGEGDDVKPVPAATLLTVDLNRIDFNSPNNVPEVYAYGLRNAFGIAVDEQQRIWVGDNGRDTPLLPDELHLVIPGAHHGFPDESAPKNAVSPVLTLGLGTSANGLDHYPSNGPWGAKYAHNIFICRFDYELNDPKGAGMDVVRIVLDETKPNQPAGVATVFATGFFHPLDVEVDPFGNLLIMEYGTWGPDIDARIFRIALADLTGDLDGDGDVDLQDYAVLLKCVNGPTNPIPPDCIGADMDHDGDVDLADHGAFQLAFTGSKSPL